MSKLVIVESPAKVKTIKKYLGKDYNVTASMGHIRDLPQNSLGVYVERGFKPQYLNIAGKEKLIKELQSEAKNSDGVILATDPDREGEAIAWHLATVLKLPHDELNRVTFSEITEKGIKEGMSHPRTINEDLFNAQQARRVLDRLVGYKLSPFLWKKVRRGLSAGRVQSVTVRILVDREREIEAFVPREYWIVDALLKTDKGRKFTVRLRTRDGVAPEDFSIPNEEECRKITDALENEKFVIDSLKKGVRHRQPEPPFITSTMQQEASRKLGFPARKTMRVAQELYEGIDVSGEGSTGLITYMRTDSLRVSDEAAAAAASFIERNYGKEYLHKGNRTYRRRGNVSAQDAHEAIRPTSVELTPERAKSSLTQDQYRLYKLIWDRFIASRMADQEQNTVTVDVRAGEYLFRASGYTVAFDGFTKLYEVSTDEKKEQQVVLPPLKEDTQLEKEEIKPSQKFTQPPARYTEASLIRKLEENGIGRPSTYAPTISTVMDRGYVERDGKSLKPTQLGIIVTDIMIDQFPDIVDEKFSADMEKALDKIEEGKNDWSSTIEKFYKGFDKSLTEAEKALDGQKVRIPDEETDVICEKCGRKMVIKTGRFGKFLACPGFPECKNTKRITVSTPGRCPKCGSPVVQRKSKRGRIFYACEKGTECGFMTWNSPTDRVCPQCGSTLFLTKGKNGTYVCEKEGCGYKEAAAKEAT
ncbi:MAG: type I DNA topoisomerase [Oscillospiraceae bacterium]|nr:type I DNA topoisomerase [Oscillospiraceae bacterium]MBR5071869.1 type I DNA topoisomerase [Oscillospiraceae bacterium]